ncbi:MAG: Smr/MutS family protein [Nevskiales bacterium]|nr:Smr/MutS family protein [Nevskiales bacterium]
MSTHDDDLNEFRRAMHGVRRQAPAGRVGRHRVMPSPDPHLSRADDRAVLEEMLWEPDPDELEHGETLIYRAPGLQDGVFRRLRRRHYRIEKVLDLHGMNRAQARIAVNEFLGSCVDAGTRCVRIIHGKGNGSPNSGPILKRLLDGWLRKRKDVLAFCSAQPVDGGSGAVYVLLRAKA